MQVKKRLRRFAMCAIAVCCCSLSLFAQQIIKGTLRNASGQPLSGATISVKNSERSAVSSAGGEFSINASVGDILLISFVGYKAQEVTVTGTAPVSVTLQEEASSMNEVVVIGYGTTTRRDISTSVAKVDPKKIPGAANNSIPELLFGRAAGLQVNQQSAQPGGNINISIRGKGTPLIVVDGVVYPNSGLEPGNGSVEVQGVNRGMLAGLNPGDIESVEFLKDASAAIYGVAASNGVMLITTKKGKAGKMMVTYDGNESFIKNMGYLKPLNATDYMTYYNQLSKDKYLADKNMAPFGSVAVDLSGFTPKFTDAQIQSAGAGTDWLGQVLRSGRIDNHAVALNGGSDKVVYYFSGSYFNQEGTLKGSGLTRYTGRLNVSFEMNKFLKLNASINANRNNYSNPQAGWQTGGSGTQGFNALQAALAYPSYLPVRDNNGNYTLFGFTGNPVSLLDISDRTNFNGMLSNISLDFTILPKILTGKISYGYNSEYAVRDFYIPKTVYWGQLYRATGNIAEDRRQNQTMEATLSFKKSFGDFVKLDAVAGVGQYIDNYTGVSVEAFGMLDAINTANIASATSFGTPTSYRGQDKYRSFFARANFDFFDRYVVALSVRRDGADKFFPDNKYQYFPSASVAWKVSNESFLRDIDVISLLKLRSSYGVTGERPGTAAYGGYAADNTSATFNSGSTIYIPYQVIRFDNPGLKWPVTNTLDVGFDFGFFKDRITGSFDWFTEDKTRLLSNATTPQLSIISTSPINGGRQRRTGYEFTLNTDNIRSKDFTWSTNINVTHFKAWWQERFPNDPPPPYAGVKDPFGTIYVYKTNGILQPGQTAPAWQPATGGASRPGAPIFVDQNGDKKLDNKDVVQYNGNPNIILGVGNTFRYKNIDLGIFLYGQFGAWGNDYTTLWGDPLSLLSNNQSGTDRIKDAWSTSNPTGTLPGVAFNESALGISPGIDIRLMRRDFLRCRNITLGYTFNNASLSKYVKSLRVYADVQNAFIITSFKTIDPEIQAASIKGGPAPYPMARTYSLGVKASF